MKKIKLPPRTYLDKERFNGIQTSGGNHYASVSQIYIRCAGNEKGCHESISIIPTGGWGNETLAKISDETAAKIFIQEGWLVKGHNGNDEYTRCPVCKKKLVKK
jgi:hypothetical protein